MTSLLRIRGDARAGRVTNVELFFDLVFAFAVTQLAHLLDHHLNATGALDTTILFLAVWWAWIYTSWVTNWLDPDRWPVRLVLLGLMFVGLVMSTSLPQAFGEKGLSFALAYVTIQVGRSLFMLWALSDTSPANTRNFQRITLWLCASGALWVAGGVLDPSMRLAIWGAALCLETLGPSLGFAIPGLGRSRTEDWDVRGGHIAERCSLFVLIALGEALLDTGETVGELAWSFDLGVAFLIAFMGCVAFWWIYFDTAAERIGEHVAASTDPGRSARLLYHYVHSVIVAGIIVEAVSDTLLLAHPERRPDAAQIGVIFGGPVLFLLGNLLFKGFARGRLPLSHLVGLALIVGVTAATLEVETLTFVTIDGAVTAIICLVAGWEASSLRRGGLEPA